LREKSDLSTVAKRKLIYNRISKIAVTGLGCGYVPFLPGTTASLFGLFIFWLVKDFLFVYGLVLISILVMGFIFVSRGEKILGNKDDKKIVIDEIFGILFCFWGVIFKGFIFGFVGFLIFRLLDILKPFPCRRIEKLPGASGVMLDDFFAAVYTNLILRGILYFQYPVN